MQTLKRGAHNIEWHVLFHWIGNIGLIVDGEEIYRIVQMIMVTVRVIDTVKVV